MKAAGTSRRWGWRIPAGRRAWRRRAAAGAVVLAVACLAGAVVAPGVAASASASSGRGGAAVPVLRWHACLPGSDAALAGFVCATAVVPLDYRYPHGAQIHLAVVKHPATGPGRLGTLFVNPGGPGALGTVVVPDLFGLLPTALAQRFDVVSWDPRGVGQSTAVQCFPSAAAEAAFLGAAALFPVGRSQQRAYIRTWSGFDLRCASRNGALLDHVTTADTARDLNLLRQAVGDPAMNYLGLSYGTYLGATYANLFPGTVRAMVLDGNVAPTAWTNNNDPHATLTVEQREGSDVAAASTLDAFLTLCGQATTGNCAFSAGTPAKTQAKFNVLLDRLRTGPITITIGGSEVTFTYASLLTDLASALQVTRPIVNEQIPSASVPGWPQFAALLQALWAADGGQPASVPAMPALGGAALSRYAGVEQNLAIKCDSPSPGVRQFPGLAAREARRAGPIGQVDLWTDEPCATWLAHPAGGYYGPWNRPTAAPILLVGNTTDPNTPYASSVLMAAELANARLLTLHGYGHTAALNPSTCVNNAEVAYFLYGTLPAEGTICQQNTAPFAPGP